MGKMTGEQVPRKKVKSLFLDVLHLDVRSDLNLTGDRRNNTA